MTQKVLSGSRNVAIVGPYSSGKTTLLESLLFVTGAISRKGKIEDGNTVGDATPEARNHKMTVEVNAACTKYGGIHFNFIDCPGSVELLQETYNALIGVDAAIVVCEPDPTRMLTLAPLFQFLDTWEIPHLLWINKMDRPSGTYSDVLTAIKEVSTRPLVLHQYPIRQGQDLVGFIDLISEQAYHYHAGAAADPVPLPETLRQEEHQARSDMLETLADFDDHLLEELLEEIEPPQEEIVSDIKLELGADLIVPVGFGIATEDYGVRPLLDALVRETPDPDATWQRRGEGISVDLPLAQVLKTYYSPQGGKLSLVRVWQGTLTDGESLNGERMGGLYQLMGQQQISLSQAGAGSIVGVARLDSAQTGDTLTIGEDSVEPLPRAEELAPVYALAVVPENRRDEVKLSGALGKLLEEDPALHWEQHGDTHEVILLGQGDMHLQLAIERLQRKYTLPMTTHLPQVRYRETIRRAQDSVHGRYKHQTGGHGQFGDVYLSIYPLERGAGFHFEDTIVGGVIPKQYIPSVEAGVQEYLVQGPLGFPVVDVAVTLTNGSYHSVDSSEQAFKQAARIAMQRGMPNCEPVLLEPITAVDISVPNSFTANVLRLISGRRGQILGYAEKPGWSGWDLVSGYIPEAELQTMILELRSLTLGVGFFQWRFDHLSPVPDKLINRILTTADAAS
ncbi:Elongation factor G [Halomicronema hongdechloris C2206]|uniref:Elongation factor G n=1 Tax=Halomicronema hongdechloris C2206 TaxID=1641165 RepID=A0A1Z3HNU6_9CYAN|nr:elongation factor G [Halomicronema hongdechloris]ASC71981.1 Elongation factor G [Halomicronema hongdechloris C2206]